MYRYRQQTLCGSLLMPGWPSVPPIRHVHLPTSFPVLFCFPTVGGRRAWRWMACWPAVTARSMFSAPMTDVGCGEAADLTGQWFKSVPVPSGQGSPSCRLPEAERHSGDGCTQRFQLRTGQPLSWRPERPQELKQFYNVFSTTLSFGCGATLQKGDIQASMKSSLANA